MKVRAGRGAFVGFAAEGAMQELVIDHVMFPVYFNNAFLDVIQSYWKEMKTGKVFTEPQGRTFKGLYNQSRSFYVEYLSTVKAEPFWSNAVYIVVPKKFWGHYKSPALVSEHFLIPRFGCGYQLVGEEFPYLNKKISADQ